MAQIIIDVGAAPDDGQGDPLRTAFSDINEMFTEVYAAGPVDSIVRIANNTITTTVTNANLVLSPSGIGKIQLNNTIFPRIDDVYDLGGPNNRFNTVYLGTGGLDISGSLVIDGNVSANYFLGNGSQLTGITAQSTGNLINGNTSVSIPVTSGNVLINVGNVANVATFAEGGLILTGSLEVDNTAFLANINSGGTTNLSTLYVGNTITTTGNIRSFGNITANYFFGNGSQLTGIVTTVSNIQNGASNVNIATPNAPVTISSNNVPNVMVISGTGVSIAGNLAVTGSVTNLNVTDLNIEDPIIRIGRGPNNTPLTSDDGYDRGEQLWYYSDFETSAFVGYKASTGNLIAATNVTILSDVVTVNNYGNIDMGNVAATSVNTSDGISAAGNVTGAYIKGNGTQLTGVMADRGGDTNNWNTLTQMGVYAVNRVSWSGVTGAPLDSQVFVGLLEVKNSGNTAIEQIFYPGTVTTNVKMQWNRGYWNGAWTNWIFIVNDEQVVSGGEF